MRSRTKEMLEKYLIKTSYEEDLIYIKDLLELTGFENIQVLGKKLKKLGYVKKIKTKNKIRRMCVVGYKLKDVL